MPEPDPAFVELTSNMGEPAIAAVWSLAAFDPSNLAHRRKVVSFYPPAGTRRMFGLVVGQAVVATCGVSEYPDRRITIHQVATVAAHRRQGLGRRLLSAIFAHLDPRRVECSTDATAAGFYQACGFAIQSEGIPPHGAERFRCTLTR